MIRHEVKLNDCHINSSLGSIQRIIAYLVYQPKIEIYIDHRTGNIVQPITLTTNQNNTPKPTSMYFGPSSLNSKIILLMNDVVSKNFPLLIQNLSKASLSDDVIHILKDYRAYFDEFHYGDKGQGSSNITSIFKTSFSQPRRINFSVNFHEPIYMESMQVYVEHLFTYGAAGRPLLDTRVRKMPYNVAYLGETCWKVVRHYLCPMTKLCPPNHCRVCVYKSKLNLSMAPHKDN